MLLNTWLKYFIFAGLFLIPFTPFLVTGSLLFPYIAGKALFFRLIVGLIFFAWVVLVARDKSYWPQASPLSWSVLAFILVMTVATIFSLNPERSFWSNFERMEGLVTYFYLGAYFLVLISVLKDKMQWRRLFQVSLAVSVVIGFLALREAFAVGAGGVRVDATLGNPIYLAVYALIHFFLAAWLWLTTERKTKWVNAAYAVVGLLELVVLYFTATRGAVLGLMGGSILMAIILAVWSNGRVRQAAGGYLILLLVLTASFYFLKDTSLVRSSPVLSRYADVSLTEGTVQSRLLIWGVAWQGFKENPILGWGPENFGLAFNKYYDPALWSQEQWFDRSHNVFFDWLMNAGLLGLLSYLSLFAAALYALRHRSIEEKALFASLLLAYFIHNFFVFDHLVSYILFFTLLAYWHTSSREQSLPAGKINLSAGLMVFIVILAAAAWSFSAYHFEYRPYRVGREIIAAISPLTGGTDDQILAVRAARFANAIKYGPFGRQEAREQLLSLALNVQLNPELAPGASAEVKSQLAAMAANEMLEEVKVNPRDVRPVYLLANFYATLGLYAEAKPLFEQARTLAPAKTGLLAELAWTYLNSGEVKRGLELAASIHKDVPAQPLAAKVYALGLKRQGDQAGARRVIKETIEANPGFKQEGESFLTSQL